MVLYLFAAFPAEGMTGRSSSRVSILSAAPSDRLQTASNRSQPNSPDLVDSSVIEMFVSEENISRMENILDTWSNSLKVSLLARTVELFLLSQSVCLFAVCFRADHEKCSMALYRVLTKLKTLKYTIHIIAVVCFELK